MSNHAGHAGRHGLSRSIRTVKELNGASATVNEPLMAVRPSLRFRALRTLKLRRQKPCARSVNPAGKAAAHPREEAWEPLLAAFCLR